MAGNSVRLTASLAAVDSLRHTPAGLPMIDFTLTHTSRQSEAGHERTVEFDMPAKAAGELAQRIAQWQPGRQVEIQGFLNRKHRMSRQIILHVTHIESI